MMVLTGKLNSLLQTKAATELLMEKELEEDIDHCVDDDVLPLETQTALKRLKTWKRACMSGERLCGLAMFIAIRISADQIMILKRFD